MATKDAILDRFLPTAQKVCQVCAHPVQDWIAIVDKNNGAQVWNWKTGEIFYAAQFGGVDESAMHYHSLQKMAEIDPAYWGAKTSQEQSVSRTPTGKLKMMHFLDVEVLHWQRTSHLTRLKSHNNENPQRELSAPLSIQKERWLVIVCENKILFYDFISHNSRELTKTALDSKNPVSISLLPNNPQSADLDDVLIAIGCTDGTIRLVSFSTLKTVVKLGYKSSAVTCLKSVHMSPVSTVVVSGSQEGSVYLWDPFPTVAGSSSTSLPPVSTSAKAHDGEVVSLTVGFTSSMNPALAVFSLGADRSVVCYEVAGLRVLSKFKGPNQRLPFHSIEVAEPIEALAERSPVLLAGQTVIWGSTLNGSNFHKLIDPAILFPSTNKKAVKIYTISLHPLHKHWLLIGTNTGVALVHLSVPFLSPTVSLPIPKTETQSFEITCLRVNKTGLTHAKYMAVSQEGGLQSMPELVKESEISHLEGRFGVAGHRQLILSPCSSKLALIQTDSNQFVIYTHISGDTWTEAMEGKGSYLVWNASSEEVAVLDVPPPSPTSTSSSRNLARMRSKVDSTHSHTSETQTPPASIKVYKIGALTPVDLNVEIGAPVLVHGGPMLGVTCNTWTGSVTHSFAFYSWQSQLPCSDELPSPKWIAWNHTNEFCVMAYQSHVLLCQARDRFRVLDRLPIVGGVNGMWKEDLIFITTHNTIESVILQRSTDPLDPDRIISIQTVVLAGFEFGVNWLTGKSENSGHTKKSRPIGHLKILNASFDKLWLIDNHEHVSILELTSPGFLALAHCSRHDFSAARNAAMGKLPSDFLGEMFLKCGKKASIEALKLPGLSLPLRLKISINAEYLKHALVCFQAILAGCARPEAVIRLPEFRETLKEESSTPKEETPTSPSVSPFSQPLISSTSMDLRSALTGESIDWELPLKQLKSKAKTEVKQEVKKEVLELGLALYDAAIAERLYSVSETVASLIIEHHDEATDSEILLQLESKLAERNYIEKLKSLAALSEKSKKSNQGKITSLSAAVLSGDSLMIDQVLQDLRMS